VYNNDLSHFTGTTKSSEWTPEELLLQAATENWQR